MTEANGPRRILRHVEAKSKAAERRRTADEIFDEEVKQRTALNKQTAVQFCGFSAINQVDLGTALRRFIDCHCTMLAIEQVMRQRMQLQIAEMGAQIATLKHELFGKAEFPTAEENEALAAEHAPPTGDGDAD